MYEYIYTWNYWTFMWHCMVCSSERPSTWSSVRMFVHYVCQPVVCPHLYIEFWLPVCHPVCCSYARLYISVFLPVFLSACLSVAVCLSICLFLLLLVVFRYVSPPVSLSVLLSVCLAVRLSVWSPVRLSLRSSIIPYIPVPRRISPPYPLFCWNSTQWRYFIV